MRAVCILGLVTEAEARKWGAAAVVRDFREI
jgi:hypothetical protein